MNILDDEKPTFGTTIFYDLYKKDELGHKIIVTLKCGLFEKTKTVEFLKGKAREIVDMYPHFRCRIVDYEWKSYNVDYDKMIVYMNREHTEIANDMLNTPFDSSMPAWTVIVSNDNHIIFSCDHTYGDGAYIATILRKIFDDDSLNNVSMPKCKNSNNPFKLLNIVSRVILFFKIIYLIYVRFISLYISYFFNEPQQAQQTLL